MTRPRKLGRGVLVASGYGLRIFIERGHLVVEDGAGLERRVQRFSKIGHGFERLIVLGHSGTVTLEALRWLRDVGVAFVQIDRDGQVVTVSGRLGTADPRLLRALALAREDQTGLGIARELLRSKLEGQASVLRQMYGSREATADIHRAVSGLGAASTDDELRLCEAAASQSYWRIWESQGVTFRKREQRRVPEHWLTFGSRHSPLTGSPRTAVNPANAILNYLYAILEAEARLAALALGLDPALGLLHADQRWRDSLACDLMEPVRPTADAFLLHWLRTRTFNKGEFFETREGQCRLLPPLTHQLAQTASKWTRAVAPVAERVAKWLFVSAKLDRPRSHASSFTLPTPLTQRRRSEGRPAPALAMTRATPPTASRTFAAKPATDPWHGGQAGQRRAQRVAAQHAAIREWAWATGGTRSADPQRFRSEVLPELRRLSLSQMAQATGLSRAYCSLVRDGKKLPHPRHWAALRKAALLH